MRIIIIVVFLLIGGFCFFLITDLFRDGILPLWAYITLSLGGMIVAGWVIVLTSNNQTTQSIMKDLLK